MADSGSGTPGAGRQEQGQGGSGGMSPLEPDAPRPAEVVTKDSPPPSDQRGPGYRQGDEQGHESTASHIPGEGPAGNRDRDDRPGSETRPPDRNAAP